MKTNFNLRKKVLTLYYGKSFELSKNGFTKKKKNKNIITTVARLDEPKDHWTLIKAFRQVKNELSQSELWIVGDGPLKNNLKRFIQKLKLEKSVKFFGWIRNVIIYIKMADIFVLSSKREGFAWVLLEAMSQGKPIISTNAPYGPAEVLGRGKYGILVPVGNTASLKESLLSLLTKRKIYQYYAQKARERSAFFSEEKMLRNYKKLIINLYNQ